jgi:hypothetical protein
MASHCSQDKIQSITMACNVTQVLILAYVFHCTSLSLFTSGAHQAHPCLSSLDSPQRALLPPLHMPGSFSLSSHCQCNLIATLSKAGSPVMSLTHHHASYFLHITHHNIYAL